MEHDAWFFIGIFAFIFIIWIATGGPTHPIAFTGPKLAQPGALGGGTYLSLPRAPFGFGGENISLPGSTGDTGVSGSSAGGLSTSLPTFLGGSSFGIPSPYRGLARVNHFVSGAGSADARNERTEISIASNTRVPVDLSGWRLLSDASGKSSTIPRGTEIPTSGTINAVEDIVLSPGIRAIVSSGPSPIGASFRENKCIGYFSAFQKFSPSLPQNCPDPSDELSSKYGTGYINDPTCIDAVDKIARCQVALTPPVSVSNTCQSFIIKYFNYNGCVEAHRNDADFLGTTWRIYLGRDTPLWRAKHEIVKLLDGNGKTVDAFSY